MGYYGIIREFSDGMQAGMFLTESCDMSWSAHKQSGYSEGCRLRNLKNEKINQHLVMHGLRPQAVITLAEKS